MTEWLLLDEIKKFEIELSSHCNARCPLCIRQDLGTDKERIDHIKGHLTFEQIKSLVEQLPDPKNVVFYFGGIGGDPMMNPEIVKIFDYCSKNLKSVIMDTNASLRSQQVWSQLGLSSKKYGSEITFSIDGLEDTNHIYRIRTEWSKIVNNAKSFINAGGYAVWKYIVFKHNQHQVKEAEELSKKLGFKEFTYENSIRHFDNIGPLQPEPPDNTNRSEIRNNIKEESAKEINCKAIEKKMLYVSNDFYLYPCCYFHTWYSYEKNVVENYMKIDNDLNNRSLINIINDKFFKNKLVNDWNKLQPNVCAKTCNQIQYWNRNIKKIKNE